VHEVHLQEEPITLGQLLKLVGLIPTGGAARAFLQAHPVFVNDSPENRRGRKLYSGDRVRFEETVYLLRTEEKSG